jgi:hypothetical protein
MIEHSATRRGTEIMTTQGKIFRIAIIALAVVLAFAAPASDAPFQQGDARLQQR